MCEVPEAAKQGGCLFCEMPAQRVIMENAHAYAIRDGFAVTAGHSLVIPKRHVSDYFGLTQDELLACDALIRRLRQTILEEDPAVAGFNIGANAGAVAGQTVFHCHIHLIPRREDDVANPRGGVRHTIPGKGFY
jgi:diadenosine tetraphosphate (Ap4A) HIT family hydrolase